MELKTMTKDEIIERAKKFNSYSEFRKQDPKAYQAIKRLGIFEEVKALFPEVKLYTQMTDLEIIEIARRYKTQQQIVKEAPSVAKEAYTRGIATEAFSHCVREESKTQATDEEIFETARQYKNFHEFMLKDKTFYNIAGKRGLIPKIKKILTTRTLCSNLTDEELIEIGRTYNSRALLRKEKSGVSKLIYQRGLTNEAFINMEENKHANYSEEELLVEMNKYKSQKELEVKDSKIYNAAKHRGILKGFYVKIQNTHAGVSVGEVSLALFLERIFNTKFDKTREVVKREDGFLELDGFSKLLNIAFEHQGDQHYLDVYRGKSTAPIKEKDRFKVDFCLKNGIKLIIIRDLINFYKNNEESIKSALLQEFNRLSIEVPSEFHITAIEIISPIDNVWTYDKVLVLAKNHNNAWSFNKNEQAANNFLHKTKQKDRLLKDMNWDRLTKKGE